ncbi:MAG: protein YgfX [Sterolibacterium sp.]
MQLPLALTLQGSRRLDLLLLAAHGFALAVLGAISAPDWMRWILLLLVCCSFGLTWQRTHGVKRIVRLLLRADGKLEYVRSNGETGETRVHPHSTVTPYLTVLLLRFDMRLEALVLLPDSLPEEAYRQLRLWLRWQAEAQV